MSDTATAARLATADQIAKLEAAGARLEATLARVALVEANQEHDKLCHVCGTKIGRTNEWPITTT